MAPPRPPQPVTFRQRMKRLAQGAATQAAGGGYQLPQVSSGIALAPAAGLAGLVGLGGVFQSLQQGIMQTFERARQQEASGTRFRAFLGAGARGEARERFLGSMMRRDSAERLGLAPEDVNRIATTIAGSGAVFGTAKEATDTSELAAAIERGFNVSVEAQAQFFSSYSRAGMMEQKVVNGQTISIAKQAQDQMRIAISEGLDEQGAGLMSADIPRYLQEISMMMTDQVRSGIRLSSMAITDLGGTFRDSVSLANRRLFQGFAGLASGQSVIGAARGVFQGTTAGIDQGLLLAEAREMMPDADLFDIARLMETGGDGGEQYAKLFSGVLERLREMAPTSQSRRMLAFSLQRQSTLFQDMGLDQILALLEGGDRQVTQRLSREDIIARGEDVTGDAQTRIARQGRRDVTSMVTKQQGQQQSQFQTRLQIIELEAGLVRDLREFSSDIELGSAKLVKGLKENFNRLGNILDTFNDDLNNVSIFRQAKDFKEVMADIMRDIKAGQRSLTPVEKRMNRKRRTP